jgi:hypothetical protein
MGPDLTLGSKMETEYMNAGIEPVPSLTYTRKVNLSPKDAIYFAEVVAHAEAREKSRLISIFARQLNALNEDRRKNLDYVFGRTN